MAEGSMALDCKSIGFTCVSSNLTLFNFTFYNPFSSCKIVLFLIYVRQIFVIVFRILFPNFSLSHFRFFIFFFKISSKARFLFYAVKDKLSFVKNYKLFLN